MARFSCFLLVVSLSPWAGTAQADAISQTTVPGGTIFRADLPHDLKLAKLAPGASFEAVLPYALYAGDREMVPAGARIRCVVDSVGKRKRTGRRLNPLTGLDDLILRRARPTYTIAFRQATLLLENAAPVPLTVRALAASDRTLILAGRGKNRRRHMGASAVLQLDRDLTLPVETTSVPPQPAGKILLPAGTVARVLLLETLSGTGSTADQVFRARLMAPVWQDGRIVLAQGTGIEGRVSASQGPRRLNRAGRLRLSFQRILAGSGAPVELSATISELNSGGRPDLQLDGEGTISAGPATKKELLLNTAVSYALGKLADDLLEEGAKGAMGVAVAGSAETAARYVGLGVGIGFFLLQRGGDVVLPEYTEFEVSLNRPLEIHQ